MVTAVNTKYFLYQHQQEYLEFIYECFTRIASRQPEHTFIFIGDAVPDLSFSFSKNCIPVFIPKFNAASLSGLLYKIKLVFVLKKYKADVFVDSDGFCSAFTKAHLCLVVHQPHCLTDKHFIKRNYLFIYKKFISFFLQKAKVIITESEFSKKYIVQHYQIAEQKIDVIYNALNFTLPTEWQQKEEIKARYSNGNEYFIYDGDTSQVYNLINLLKAFSHFKKWQKSSMQLFIAEKNVMPQSFIHNLKLFKYRDDVKLLNNLSAKELTKITAAAYCMIHFPYCETFASMPLQAMQYNVPVITVNTAPITEIFGDAALYVNPDDPTSIAEKLMLVFKDEKLRGELIEKGQQQIKQFSWKEAAEIFWRSLLKAGS